MPDVIAPGALIEVRDALWRVLKVDRASTGRAVWTVTGVSSYIQDEEAVFLEDYEPAVRVLAPEETKLVTDTSAQHRAGLLYLESLLQDLPPPDDALVIGHKGAFDPLPYQLDPARQALSALRARILIADAVGLGKTLEAGVLLSELIRRGKAKRILVVAVKSMLTQFQKELWSRFAIPLVRLDSEGLKRIRERVPVNHNPFHYYDQVIISVDTLKQSNWFRTHLEASRWDVIVIDEAHNVAERGTNSQRSKLARTLASRSDALIMLSATPHDGRARSFASLMNMLDPTAIANPEKYTPDEIRGLFIRRFKKDIKDQVASAFPERVIKKLPVRASAAEEAAYEALGALSLKKQARQGAGGNGMLFKTLLEKALFSSPVACLKTVAERIKKLEPDAAKGDADAAHDLAALRGFEAVVKAIGTEEIARYRYLVEQLADKKKGLKWSRKPNDRLVIFTERVDTLHFLAAALPDALGLKPGELEVLHGTMPDLDQQRVVEAFGQERAKVRLLVASDVASEGINLHFQSHRLIHFDVPWSLMVFQQRNGRVDRYGQEQRPEIYYLLAESTHPKIRGDARILELLIEKEDEATRNIGDPAALMGKYDQDAEETATARAIEDGATPEAFVASWTPDAAFDPLEFLLQGAEPATPTLRVEPHAMPSVFRDTEAFLVAALDELTASKRTRSKLDVRRTEAKRFVEFSMPDDLARRYRRIPAEVPIPDGRVQLTADRALMQQAIRAARSNESAWPELQYLWELHPVVTWARDRMRALFGRHEAPILDVNRLAKDERVLIVSGLIPNRRGQPVVHRWYSAVFRGKKFERLEDLDALLARTKLGTEPLANTGRPPGDMQALVPEAVKRVRERVIEVRAAEETARAARLNQVRAELKALRGRKEQQLELDLAARGA
jgi:superfamily II DNA or RNA helicase